MNIFINTAADDLNAATVTSLTDPAEVTDFKQLALRDSEPLVIKFMDGSAAESWSGDATYTLSVAIGESTATGDSLYSSVSSFSTISNGWSGRISLATDALINACYRNQSRSSKDFIQLFMHIRVADPSNNVETYALIPIVVSYSVFPQTTLTQTESTYYTAAQMLALFCQNRSTVTSLTGGGVLTLDGIATASNAMGTGAVVLISINAIAQHWQLLAGTDAEDGLTVVRPDDYDATTNARVWKLL